MVRNMRPEGYVLQTGGSATRQEILMEGSQQDPLFRVTGVPLHTHNATALLEVEMSMVSEAVGGTRFVSNAGEFSAPDLNIAAGDLVEAYEDKDDFQEDIDRLQRAIEFGVGRVQLQPENCVNFISEPTRAIAEIRTLVCAKDSLKTMTFVDQTWAYTDRKGVGIDTNFPHIVHVPVLPVNNMHVESNFASRLHSDTNEMLHLEFWSNGQDVTDMDRRYQPHVYNDWLLPSDSVTSLKDDDAGAIEYPVAYVRIGRGSNADPCTVEVKRRGEYIYSPWDGTVPYVYDDRESIYAP